MDCGKWAGIPKAFTSRCAAEMHANKLQDVSGEAPRVGSAAGQSQDLKDMTSNLVSCYMSSLETMPQGPKDHSNALRKKRSFAHNRAIIFDRPWPSCQKPTAGSWNIVILKVLRWKRRGASSGCPSPRVYRLHAKSLEMLRQQLARLTAPRVGPTPATFPSPVR